MGPLHFISLSTGKDWLLNLSLECDASYANLMTDLHELAFHQEAGSDGDG